ncbi:MAG: hypothetical protein IJP48_06965 [Synergistaceae bacterium]|nr:hypothetical protein [Synergistaceae bacterium]
MKLFIEEYEDAIAAGKNPSGEDFSFQTFSAYEDSKDAGLDRLNFRDIIWDKDISKVVASLKKFGILEFTISNQSSGILETLAGFERNGVILLGLTRTGNRHLDSPAFLMKII